MVGRSIQRKLEEKSIPEAADVAALVSDIENAKRQIRLLSRGLIPRDVGPEGLPAALSDLTVRFATIYGIDCRFEGEQTVAVKDDLSATQLFRIAQEALRNAVEHAEPTRILVILRQRDGQVALEVRDNGKGLPATSRDAPGVGLRIMRYRANLIGASFSVESTPGEGTTMRCILGGGQPDE
jgi:signal transduction histidine kinase